MNPEEAAKLIEECGYKACTLCSKKDRCEDEEKIDTALGMAVDALRAIAAIKATIEEASRQIHEIVKRDPREDDLK
jgi:hypothetical protein